MNIFEYNKAIRNSGLKHLDRLVLRTLADYKNWAEDGLVWPSQKTIANDTGMSRQRVNEAFGNLKDAGWIVVISTTPTSTRYKLVIPAQEFGEIEVSM